MKRLVLAAILGTGSVLMFTHQAEAAPEPKFTVKTVAGDFAPIQCPVGEPFTDKTLNADGEPVGKIPPGGIRDCNNGDGTVRLVLNNSANSPTKFSAN